MEEQSCSWLERRAARVRWRVVRAEELKGRGRKSVDGPRRVVQSLYLRGLNGAILLDLDLDLLLDGVEGVVGGSTVFMLTPGSFAAKKSSSMCHRGVS